MLGAEESDSIGTDRFVYVHQLYFTEASRHVWIYVPRSQTAFGSNNEEKVGALIITVYDCISELCQAQDVLPCFTKEPPIISEPFPKFFVTEMSRRVYVPERVPKHVRESIERLRVLRRRHNRIRAGEAAQAGVVVARPHVDQPQVGMAALAGEAQVGWEGARAPAKPAVGQEALLGRDA